VLSSSNKKLERAKSLGATVLINYRETPESDVAVMEATDGEGASHILELGGADMSEWIKLLATSAIRQLDDA
jgi:NADPH:quinone reductase-like Zn-dependent oxidoreductase